MRVLITAFVIRQSQIFSTKNRRAVVKFDQLPLIVVLGSQVHYDEAAREYSLAAHTYMKVEASAIALRMGVTERMIFSGGYNFGVRYDDENIMSPPDFSFQALATAQRARTSEARAMRDIAHECFDVKSSQILLEEGSATTEENAAFVNIMLKRSTFTGMTKIGVLALLHHLPRALTIFKAACAGFEIMPVIAEDLLATKGNYEVDKIAKYYVPQRSGKQYDAKKIRQLLADGQSLVEMME